MTLVRNCLQNFLSINKHGSGEWGLPALNRHEEIGWSDFEKKNYRIFFFMTLFKNCLSSFYPSENILGKGENADYRYFLLLPTMFSKGLFLIGHYKSEFCCEELNNLLII